MHLERPDAEDSKCSHSDRSPLLLPFGIAIGIALGAWAGYHFRGTFLLDEPVMLLGDYGQKELSAARTDYATASDAQIIIRKGTTGILAYRQGPYSLVDFRLVVPHDAVTAKR